MILQSLTWPQDQIFFPMSVLSHLSVLKPYFCTIFFQRDTSFVTAADETGGKYKGGRVASPESIPRKKMGFTVLIFDFIMLPRAKFSSS